MSLRFLRAVLIGLVTFGLIVSGCQSVNNSPAIGGQPADTHQTPPVEKTKSSATPAKTKTIIPTLTNTPDPHLAVDLKKLNGLTITVWHPWSDELNDQLDKIVQEFNKKNEWGIRIEPKAFYSAGTLFDGVASALSEESQALPNALIAPSEQLSILTTESDALLDLDDYISHPEYGFSSAKVDSFLPIFWEQDQTGDKQIAIPILRTANVMFYNQSWARELGFQSPPKDPAGFKTQACAAAVENNSVGLLDLYGTGGWLVDTDSITTLSWLQSFNESPLIREPAEIPAFDSPSSEDAVLFLRSMLEDGCAWLNRNEMPNNLFSQRKALFFSGTLQEIQYQRKLNQVTGFKDEWTILPYIKQNGDSFVFSSGYSLAVMRSRNADLKKAYQEDLASWLFIRWISDTKNQRALGDVFLSVPVSTDVLDQINASQFPWRQIVTLHEVVLPVPSHPSWRSVRRMVEDAGWQIFHLPADQVKTILPQLDQEVNEALQKK